MARYTEGDVDVLISVHSAHKSMNGQTGQWLAVDLREALRKIDRLQRIVVRYGDKGRMAWASPELQKEIDEAFSKKPMA
jgi:hypothetical protein